MPTVLLVAYYFPPLGMGGSQRPAKFAKYLPEFGWTPVVLTVEEVAYYAQDPDLVEDVRRVHVVRTGSLDPPRLLARRRRGNASVRADAVRARGGFLGTINRLFVPDSKILWLPFAVGRALRLLRNIPFEVILTTSPPHSVHLGGWLLKRLTGRPWVADFRDPWAGGEFQPGTGGWHRRVDELLEFGVLRHADAVVAVSEGLARSLEKQAGWERGRVAVIPNGFDEADFCGCLVQRPEAFTFTMCGALRANRGLKTLLAAAGRPRQGPDEKSSNWRLRLVGAVVDPQVSAWIGEAGLGGRIEVIGYRPHRQAVAEMVAADALIYLIPDRASPGHIPGKTFEYLRAGKRVLAIGPDVEGTRILRQHLPVVSCTSDDVDAVFQAMNELARGSGAQGGVEGSIARYARRHQTGQLAELLARVSGRDPNRGPSSGD